MKGRISREIFDELHSNEQFLVISVAWIVLGIVAFLSRGFWLYLTVPLFGVLGATVRVLWKRRQGKEGGNCPLKLPCQQ